MVFVASKRKFWSYILPTLKPRKISKIQVNFLSTTRDVRTEKNLPIFSVESDNFFTICPVLCLNKKPKNYAIRHTPVCNIRRTKSVDDSFLEAKCVEKFWVTCGLAFLIFFILYLGIIQMILKLYCSGIEFVLEWYSSGIREILKLYLSCIWVILKSYASRIQVMLKSYWSRIQVVFKWYWGCNLLIFELYSWHIQVVYESVFKSYSSGIEIVFKLFLH